MTYYLVFFIMLLITTPLVFGQEDYSDPRIEKLQNDVLELREKNQNDPVSWELYAAVAGILIALTGVLLSNHQTRNSNQIAKNSFESFKKTSEADLLLRLNDAIYRSDEGKKILESARLGLPILEQNQGNVTERELENFLNEVETVSMLIKQGTLTSSMAEQGFGWVIERVKENPEIMEYIKNAQKKYGDYAWIEITNYDKNNFVKEDALSNITKSKSSEIILARIQVWTTAAMTLGATVFALGAAMWLAALSTLSTLSTMNYESKFLLSLVNGFNQLGPIFTISGMIMFLFGFLYPMYLLRNKPSKY